MLEQQKIIKSLIFIIFKKISKEGTILIKLSIAI